MRLIRHLPPFPAFLLPALLLLVVSCDRGSRDDETASPGSLSLKIGAMPSMDILPFLVAEKAGVYDSLGLNLEVVKFYSAIDRDAAFQSHNVEGTVIDYTGAMMQQAAGIPLRLVMKLDGYFLMMARPGFGGGSSELLRGARIGVSSNTVIEYATDMVLRRAGIPLDAVHKQEVSKIPLRMEMLRGGKMDASILPDPFITITKEEGLSVLASTEEMGIHVTGLILSLPTIEQKREAVELLLQGYDRGVELLLTRPIEEFRETLVKEVGFPEELASKVLLPAYTPHEAPNPEDLQGTLLWLRERSLVPEVYSTDSLVAEF